jgi:hypothetical protein
MVGAAFSVIWVYAGELLPSTGTGFRVQGLVRIFHDMGVLC